MFEEIAYRVKRPWFVQLCVVHSLLRAAVITQWENVNIM